ncbi:hypothetical protein [Streptomyces erythrochromogenes]|uniref:hypothetical protein n=1 Tax=Streptomyces erythrochromogenes TaxID=285574 RepID=UPI00386C511E|nr:hypothetical protein OG489_00300 [Streptomyces erythrochromogenes]WSR88308.1 hypothetical protein OG489_39660 [Streptomyces erythrochromogenes]
MTEAPAAADVPAPSRYVGAWRRGHAVPAGQLDFPPIRNGVDYLRSVVEHLGEDREDDDPRAVKYAVLHLQAAAEVLLKTYLLHEHWALIVADPGKASKKAFESGDFKSCTMEQAMDRLKNIAGITITDPDRKALAALNDDRNQLQHYGLTHSTKTVEARAAAALDFLVRFLDTHLLPRLDTDARMEIWHEMARVREGLKQIESYVKERMNRLRGELQGQETRTLHCPECDQPAFVVGPGSAVCHFCGQDYTEAIVLVMLFGAFWEEDSRQCPACNAPTLFDDISFLEPPVPGEPAYSYCFACDSTFTHLASCERCHRPVESQPDDGTGPSPQVLCPDCVGHAYPPEEHENTGG